jgi:hypothetical protein
VANSLGQTFWPWTEISVCEKWWKLFKGEYGSTAGYKPHTSNYFLDRNVRAECCVIAESQKGTHEKINYTYFSSVPWSSTYWVPSPYKSLYTITKAK